ncbi:hypothetical protein B296_00004198 [Ensete ventricosum]|uniref:Uncharacterized protein n=1 Tax=Ensete ventricosum TaxID=4639 RepID=A0A426XW00_ENSVE|nr:hypothetical protein B296_00004198 [Ensete ventricosum]
MKQELGRRLLQDPISLLAFDGCSDRERPQAYRPQSLKKNRKGDRDQPLKQEEEKLRLPWKRASVLPLRGGRSQGGRVVEDRSLLLEMSIDHITSMYAPTLVTTWRKHEIEVGGSSSAYFTISKVPRADNSQADPLARLASTYTSGGCPRKVERLLKLTIATSEVATTEVDHN